MKKLIVAISLIVLASCSRQEDKPATYSMAEFMDIVSINGGSFSPDETKILFNSRETGIFNAVEIDLNTGEQKARTQSTTDAIMAEGYFPEDNRFLYVSDRGGNEISHIYVQNPEGNVTDLISDSTAKAVFYGWSYDRKKMYYASNSRDSRFFDLYQVKVGGNEKEGQVYVPAQVYKNEKGLNVAAISNDDRYLALVESVTTNDGNMYLFDTQSGELKLLSSHMGSVQFSPQYFSLDGKQLVYLTDEGSEYMYLATYNIATGEHQMLENAPWDISYSYISKNGKYRVVAINNDAKTEMKIYDRTGNLIELPGLPAGEITGVNISDSEKLMSFYVSSSRNPSNLFLYNFETKEIKQLTNTMNKRINPDDLVEGSVIRYKSYDGMEIPSLLYKPKGIGANEKIPALLWIHGGPGGQTRLGFSSAIQYLVNHGYAVLAVNNRGSSGYGKTFFAADDRKHGDADLKDCVSAKDYLATLPYIDTNRIGIMGGSYGGYMTMAALTFTPEAFKVGVNLFGVTNWLRTLRSIPAWWGSNRTALYAELGDPYGPDSTALYNKSPLFFADKITKPFIVLQGSNDPRVLQIESDEIVEAARKNGITVDYVIFPDEGHGFVKKENNIKAFEEVLKFLDKNLKGINAKATN